MKSVQRQITCSVALFTIANIWKQAKYPSFINGLRKCGKYTRWSIIQPNKERYVLCDNTDKPG
jgi:hypothetical protein